MRRKERLTEVVYEIYRRQYAEAIDKDNNYGDFDYLCVTCKKEDGRLMIPYESYYLEDNRQLEIIDEVCSNFKDSEGKKMRLTKDEKTRIRNTVQLGCSPLCSYTGFCRRQGIQ